MARSIGTREDLIERAHQLVPAIAARQDEAERLRRIPDASVAELREAGLHRILQPARYGGAEAHFAGMLDVVSAVSNACASTGWVLAQYISHNCLFGYWPAAGQDEIWGAHADVTTSGVLIPACGRAERVNGNWQLSGQWPFASGVYGADWFIAAAFVEGAGGDREARLFAVPRAEIEILDTWRSVGLRATGSADVKINETQVPEHRSLKLDATKGGGTAPGCTVNAAAIFKLGAFSMFSINQGAVSYGIARAVVDNYVQQTRERVARSSGGRIAEYATAQSKVAEAAVCADTARLLLYQCCDQGMAVAERGEVAPMELKTKVRATATYAGNLAARAVDLICTVAGGGALYDTNPLSRAMRDMRAAQAHITQTWDANGVNYGRVLLGLSNTDPAL